MHTYRLRHRMIEDKHRGHDLMHAEMFLILFSSIGAAQVLLFIWKYKHKRSYQVIGHVICHVLCMFESYVTACHMTFVYRQLPYLECG